MPASPPSGPASHRPLVIGCGALGRELVELTRRAGLPAMDLACLPASLHNRPERIPGAVAARIRQAHANGYEQIFVAYADCGTGGRLDRVLQAEGVARLEGAHCYEVYAGRAAFAALADAEPGTFYLTDYLVRSFDSLVVRGLGLDRHPELLPLYFGNYRRLVYLAQTDDPSLTATAEGAAARLGLAFERRFTGLGDLASALAAFAVAPSAPSQAGTAGHDSPTNADGDRRGRRLVRVSLTERHDRVPERVLAGRRKPFGPRIVTARHRARANEPVAPGSGSDRGDSLTHGHRRPRARRAPEGAEAA